MNRPSLQSTSGRQNVWRRTMNDLEREKPETKEHDDDPMRDAADKTSIDTPPVQPGLRERVWKLLNGVQQRKSGTKRELAEDRTRSLALLIGGTVGAVLLFIGVFSTPTTPPIRETGGRAAPNLGRPSAAPNQTT